MSGTTIARAASARGELVLRRRDWDSELELRVNGVFVMDSYETATERALAVLALDSITRRRGELKPGSLTVLVGGLGLGYTLAQFMASQLVAAAIVAEIEPALVDWHRGGLVPVTEQHVQDPRVQLWPVDIRDVVDSQPAGSLDVIVLDVDNGPGYLVYESNSAVYQREFLVQCRDALADKGVVVVWSADRAPELSAVLEDVFGGVSQHAMGVRRGERADHYYAYVAPAHPEDDEPCPDR